MYVKELLLLLCVYKVQSLSVRIADLGSKKIIYDLTEAKELFNDFVEYFQKKYKDQNEYKYRLEIFTKNLRNANDRNKNNNSEVYGITQFSDLTEKEFIEKHTGFKAPMRKPLKMNFNNTLLLNVQNVPEQWDWRSKGVVSPVRNQGFHCGSCWAFSAVGCIEGQHAIKHGQLYSLSEQQLLDCSRGGTCAGGHMELAFNGIARHGGLVSNEEYPYLQYQGRCRFHRERILAKVLGGRIIYVPTEEYLKQIVYKYGPVSISLHANQGFMQYRGQIATPQYLRCHARAQPNHAVLLVGYGTENGVPYWIIKNSHGSGWGEQGYMRLQRGVNLCSILSYIAIADVA